MTLTPTPLVSVCVCTYKRPHLLAKLLESLLAQTLAHAEFEVVIADNDSAASAQAVVDQFTTAHPALRIRYEIEPQQGISFARNRTVAMARGAWLAFIDDDEHAVPQWLTELLACQREYQADAVMGPVLPIFPTGSAHWAVQSGFFERPRFESGTRLPWRETRTSNALVGAHWASQRQPYSFSPELAWSGGEDTDFFKWMDAAGGRFVWCDTAPVAEEVPLQRQTLGFILERSFRSSVTYWRALYPQHSLLWRYREAAWGLVGGVGMLVLGLLHLLRGRGYAVPVWSKSMKAFGRIAALSRVKLVGYK